MNLKKDVTVAFIKDREVTNYNILLLDNKGIIEFNEKNEIILYTGINNFKSVIGEHNDPPFKTYVDSKKRWIDIPNGNDINLTWIYENIGNTLYLYAKGIISNEFKIIDFIYDGDNVLIPDIKLNAIMNHGTKEALIPPSDLGLYNDDNRYHKRPTIKLFKTKTDLEMYKLMEIV